MLSPLAHWPSHMLHTSDPPAHAAPVAVAGGGLELAQAHHTGWCVAQGIVALPAHWVHVGGSCPCGLVGGPSRATEAEPPRANHCRHRVRSRAGEAEGAWECDLLSCTTTRLPRSQRVQGARTRGRLRQCTGHIMKRQEMSCHACRLWYVLRVPDATYLYILRLVAHTFFGVLGVAFARSPSRYSAITCIQCHLRCDAS